MYTNTNTILLFGRIMVNNNEKQNICNIVEWGNFAQGIFANQITVAKVTMDRFFPFYFAHFHNELEILQITDGNTEVIVNGNVFDINKGDVVAFLPSSVHCVKPHDSKLSFVAVGLSPSIWQEQSALRVGRILQNSQFPVILRANDPCCAMVTKRIDELANNSQSKTNCALAILNTITAKSTAIMQQNTTTNRHHYAVMRALRFAKENFRNNISIEDVANFCQYSTFYTMKLFKSYTGLPFVEYLNHFRLLLASQQMLTTNKEMQQIAQDVGFNNISYFNRQFKRMFDLTPKQYQAHFANQNK